MENEKIEMLSTQPKVDAENLTAENEATTPQNPPKQSDRQGITLKFNKETREIPYDEAVALAQKGLKFDSILPDFQRLKDLAARDGKSVSDYITEIEAMKFGSHRAEVLSSCAGNEELADRILELEKAAGLGAQDKLSALSKEFPEIKSIDDLPSEVIDSVELLGGNLLSAYLLYNHRQQKAARDSQLKQLESKNASVGSQAVHAAEKSSVNEEFIKGIWS